jgi:hypothetical protein
VDADGSQGRPFNATSASAASTNPIAQAHADMPGSTSQAEEEAPRIIHVGGGEYTAALTFNTAEMVILDVLGDVLITGNMTVNVLAKSFEAGLVGGLTIGPGPGGGGSCVITGNLSIGDNDVEDASPVHVLRLRNTTLIGTLNDSATASSGLSIWTLIDCTVNGATTHPTGRLLTGRTTRFAGAFSIEQVDYASHVFFGDDVTVQSATGSVPFGWHGCQFGGDFTGPAGSARWDAASFSSFSGTFSGGAGIADFIESIVIKGTAQIDLGNATVTVTEETLGADFTGQPVNLTPTGSALDATAFIFAYEWVDADLVIISNAPATANTQVAFSLHTLSG